MFEPLVKRLSVWLLAACSISFLGTGVRAGDDGKQLTFDTWNFPYAAVLEMKKLDSEGSIDFDFRSNRALDYDFMLVVPNGMENIEEFPLYRKFKLGSTDAFDASSGDSITEIEYLINGDVFRLIIVDISHFSGVRVFCMGEIVFNIISGPPLTDRSEVEIDGAFSCAK
jgi:hypothetical protein